MPFSCIDCLCLSVSLPLGAVIKPYVMIKNNLENCTQQRARHIKYPKPILPSLHYNTWAIAYKMALTERNLRKEPANKGVT